MFLKFDRQLVNVQNIRTIDEMEYIDGKKTVRLSRISFKNDEYIIVNTPFDVVWETLKELRLA